MGRRSSAPPVKLGEKLLGPMICHGSTQTPTAPDITPEYEIRDIAGLDSGTPLVSGTVTALSGVTGGYYVNKTIQEADGFEAGSSYVTIITYQISAVTYRDIIDFPVV